MFWLRWYALKSRHLSAMNAFNEGVPLKCLQAEFCSSCCRCSRHSVFPNHAGLRALPLTRQPHNHVSRTSLSRNVLVKASIENQPPAEPLVGLPQLPVLKRAHSGVTQALFSGNRESTALTSRGALEYARRLQVWTHSRWVIIRSLLSFGDGLIFTIFNIYDLSFHSNGSLHDILRCLVDVGRTALEPSSFSDQAPASKQAFSGCDDRQIP